MEKEPRSSRSMERTASASDAPAAMWCSMRWAMTSVSVSELSGGRRPRSLAESSA